MDRASLRRVLVLVACAGSATPTLAIDSPPVVPPLAASPAPANSARNYVGRGQTENTDVLRALCTETHLGAGVVLTAAHCVFSGGQNDRRYENMGRFALGGAAAAAGDTVYMALSVTSQAYAGNVGAGNNDIALRYIINGQNANAAPANILASAADEQWIIDRINPTPPPVGPPAPPVNVPFALVGWKQNDTITSPNLLEGVIKPRLGPPPAPADQAGLIGAGYTAGEWIYSTVPGSGNNLLNRGDSGGPSFAMVNGVERLVGVHSYGINPVAGADSSTDILDGDTRVSPHLNFIAGKGSAAGGGGLTGVWDRLTAGPGTFGWNLAGSWTRQSTPVAATVPQAGDIVILDPTGGSDRWAYTVLLAAAGSANIMGLANDVTIDVSNGVSLNVGGQSGIVNAGIIMASGAGTRVISATNVDNGGNLLANDQSAIQIGAGMRTFNRYPQAAVAAGGGNPGSPAFNDDRATKSLLNGADGRVILDGRSSITATSLVDNRGLITLNNRSTGRIALDAGSNGVMPATTQTVTSPAGGGGGPLVLATTELNALFNAVSGRVDVLTGSSLSVGAGVDNRNIIIVGSQLAGFRSSMTVGANFPVLVGRTAAGGDRLPIAIDNGRFGTDAAGNSQVLIEAGGDLVVSNGASRTATFSNGARGELWVRGDGVRTASMVSDFLINSNLVQIRKGADVLVLNGIRNASGGQVFLSGQGAGGDTTLTGAVRNFSGTGGATPRPAAFIEIGERGRLNARPATDNPGLALDNQPDARVNIGARGNAFVEGNAENRGSVVIQAAAAGIGQYNGLPEPGAGAGVRGSTLNFGRFDFQSAVVSRPAANLTNHDFTNRAAGVIGGHGLFVMGGLSDWTSESTFGTGNASNFTDLNMLWDGAGTPGTFARFEALSKDLGKNVNALSLQFSFNLLSFANSSKVELVDNIVNDGGGEVVYTRFLGITGNSTVKLNGRTIYYLLPDPAKGLDLNLFDLTGGGAVVQIPTPAALPALALAGVFASRRRRAVG